MRKALYLRLATRNVWRTRQSWHPFLLASSLLTFALYSLTMLATAPQFSERMGGTGTALTQTLMWLGVIVVSGFTAVFLFYADGFLIRRRKKELGLYAVLGMERKQILRVQLWELAQAYGVTLLAGLGLGMVLARLMFLLLKWVTKLEIEVTGAPNPAALAFSAALMGVVFLLLAVRHGLAVWRTRPVELLHASQQGEREPKARWLLALLGVATLGAGYFIALTVNDPVTALVQFFIAVLLVIVGTYLVFLTTSVAVLKALKGRKSFYYTSRHFVSLSGMLYRMKANAAGLASIAILTTMAMVTIGTTSALFLGAERTLEKLYPKDNCFTFWQEEQAAAGKQAVLDWSAESGVAIQDMEEYDLWECMAVITADGHLGRYVYTTSNMSVDDLHQQDWGVWALSAVSQEDFERCTGEQVNLGNEILGWVGENAPATLEVDGKTWLVETVPEPKSGLLSENYDYLNGSALLIFPTIDAVEEFAVHTAFDYDLNEDGGAIVKHVLRFDWAEGDRSTQQVWDQGVRNAVWNALLEATDGGFSLGSGQKATQAQNYYGLYGALVFIGIFLGLVFLMGTLLIIYFKQLSEGYQDHDRYIILQKVGMSRQDVRRAVKRQILTVFMAPLLVALCHVGGSLHMIMLMLRMFGLSDTPFIAVCSLGAALVVGVAYLLFYLRTAGTYYKLVQFTSVSEGA